MAFTIDNMLQLPEFASCRLIAGGNGIGREIHCVDTMEVPDIIPWIKKGELLLTTGYSIKGHTEKLLDMLDTMYKRDSAGLAIKTRFIGPIMQDVIARAEQYRLPLIIIPDQTAFIPLLNAVGGCIANERNRSLIYTLSVSREIADAQQDENSVQSIEKLLYQHLSMPVVLLDFLLAPYETYPPGTENPVLQESIRQQFLPHMSGCAESLFTLSANTPDLDSIVVQKIRFKGIVTGYLLILVPPGGCFEHNDEQAVLLNNAVDALAFQMTWFQNAQVRQRDRGLYSKLLQDDAPAAGVVNHWISQYDWPSPPLNLITVVQTADKQAQDVQESQKLQIIWTLYTFFSNRSIPCVAVPYEDSVRCIASARPADRFQQILTQILKKLQEELGSRFQMAVSAPFSSYAGLRSAHQECFYVCQIARRLGMDVACAENLSMEMALVRGANSVYLKQFIHVTLGPLKAYDDANHAALLPTVQALVNHLGVHTQTANALYLHRNTLLSRIQKIENLTGLNLSCSEDLCKIAFALKIQKLLG